MPSNLTVEIFRDKDSPDLCVDAVEDGIDQLRRIATGIKIVRASRLLALVENSADPTVDVSRVAWPQPEADMNIVLTERHITDSENQTPEEFQNTHISGVAIVDEQSPTHRFAIVDTLTAPWPGLTVAHESAHMLGVKSEGDK